MSANCDNQSACTVGGRLKAPRLPFFWIATSPSQRAPGAFTTRKDAKAHQARNSGFWLVCFGLRLIVLANLDLVEKSCRDSVPAQATRHNTCRDTAKILFLNGQNIAFRKRLFLLFPTTVGHLFLAPLMPTHSSRDANGKEVNKKHKKFIFRFLCKEA